MSQPDLGLNLVREPDQVSWLIRKIERCELMGFDAEYSGPRLLEADYVNVHQASLTGISFAFLDITAYYVPIRHVKGNCPPADVQQILSALSQRQHLSIAHNLKAEMEILRDSLPQKCGDSMILMWLLGLHGEGKGGKMSYGLKQLIKKHYKRDPISFEDVSKGRQFSALDPEEALPYACWDAWNTLELWHDFYPKAEKMRVDAPLWEQEMPCVEVVCAMERAGMPVNPDRLLELYEELASELESIKEEWEFLVPDADIGSSSQVSDYFFAKANGVGRKNLWPTKGISRGKPRKIKHVDDFKDVTYEHLPGRLSVNKTAMQLAVAHPRTPQLAKEAAQLRLRFQALDKNRSTYTTKLVASARQHLDGRIHASFHQTGTRTGRFSSSNPNLQNIPVRSELGRKVKQAFEAPEGFLLLAADYSQIELRVLAHLTQKGYLYAAYTTGADIHQETATKLGVSRDLAKTLNFAIIYGAGPKKLAQTASISMPEAKRLLDGMREIMAEEHALMRKVVASARRRGFVRTAVGRIRRIPEFRAHEGRECQRTADNWECEWCYQVSKAARIAGNMPVQGLAGDIFKRAMVAIHCRLKALPDGTARIVGQIHDEITLEVKESEVEGVAELVRKEMEAAYPLRVPLVAEPKWAKNWAECK